MNQACALLADNSELAGVSGLWDLTKIKGACELIGLTFNEIKEVMEYFVEKNEEESDEEEPDEECCACEGPCVGDEVDECEVCFVKLRIGCAKHPSDESIFNGRCDDCRDEESDEEESDEALPPLIDNRSVMKQIRECECRWSYETRKSHFGVWAVGHFRDEIYTSNIDGPFKEYEDTFEYTTDNQWMVYDNWWSHFREQRRDALSELDKNSPGGSVCLKYDQLYEFDWY
jgi:hypothetical protein